MPDLPIAAFVAKLRRKPLISFRPHVWGNKTRCRSALCERTWDVPHFTPPSLCHSERRADDLISFPCTTGHAERGRRHPDGDRMSPEKTVPFDPVFDALCGQHRAETAVT